jgi:hypothetical protein
LLLTGAARIVIVVDQVLMRDLRVRLAGDSFACL